MIPEFGLFCLILAFSTSIFMVIPILGFIHPKLSYLQKISIPAVLAQCFFVTLSFLTLTACFVLNDFSVSYVAQNSNSQLPLIYKICAVWGAHEGSLLLWALILSIWTFVVALATKSISEEFRVVLFSILGAINVGFLFLLLQTSNPFVRLLPFFPSDGSDLNPLLQDPGFILHPPSYIWDMLDSPFHLRLL